MQKINITKEKLKKLYEEKGLSSYSIAKIYKCDPTVIQKRLKEHNIKIRQPKKKIWIPKDKLIELYLTKELSTYKIAKLFNCSNNVISRRLNDYNIKARSIDKIPISREELYDRYIIKKWPLSKIAKKFSCSNSTIFDNMKKHNIPSRTMSEAKTIYPRKNFSKNSIEKSYLIGFRVGDLNVTKRYLSVCVKSNTTKLEQVELIKELFHKYGKVYMKRYGNVFNIQCMLNSSFSFLIPKKDNIQKWILRSRKYFMAFLAGYMDAEGNIGVYSNRARIRVGSYDKKLLEKIHKKLLRMNIHNKYRLETLAGTNKQNKDFWRVSINKKEDILRLITLIKPYLKHQKRCKDLKMAEDNIISRIKRNRQ